MSLTEDVGEGDITAALIPPEQGASATIMTRESAILCGVDWVNEVYHQIDSSVIIRWKVNDGERIYPNQYLAELQGPARSLLTGERCALNWLQTLSGTATTVDQYLRAVADTSVQLLDTRKTIPGLRYAQKYAVRCAGGKNHRMGLYDAYLIKENHIATAGSIARVIQQARHAQPGKTIEIEVQSLCELQEALDASADIVLLDNFNIEDIQTAVALNRGRVKLEVSGGVDLSQLRLLAKAGVDFISIGALTKHVRAIDLTLTLRCAPP